MAGPFVQVVQTYPQIFRPKFDRVPVRPLVKASIDEVDDEDEGDDEDKNSEEESEDSPEQSEDSREKSEDSREQSEDSREQNSADSDAMETTDD